MNEDVFNASLRGFLKKVGITSQREIEKAVRDAVASGRLKGHEKLPARMVLTLGGASLSYEVTDEIELATRAYIPASRKAFFSMDCRVIPDQVGDRPPAMTKRETMELAHEVQICATDHRSPAGRTAPCRLPRAGTADHGRYQRRRRRFCRTNNVELGSNDYIACRKDRDVQRANADARSRPPPARSRRIQAEPSGQP